MRGSRNFRQGGGGGPGQSDKKSSDVFCFFRPQLINLSFFKVPEGANIFQGGGGSNFFQGGGGSNFFQGGGSNCLFPIETHITCDFPGGGGVRTPCPPLWIHT